MTSVLVSAPETEPVSLEEAKAHLNVDFDDDDALIEVLISASRSAAERFTGRAFIEQTWDLFLDEFPSDGSPIKIAPAPLIEILSVGYGDDYSSLVAASGYRIDLATAPARLALVDGGSWPTINTVANAIRIRFRAGYVDDETSPVTGEVPADIKAAILLTVGSLYANREDVVVGQTTASLPLTSEYLLRPYRIHTGMA